MMQISCKNVSVSYENRLAIDNVAFDVSAGDYIAIVGENGSGKSTLIKAILGLIKYKSGSITFENGVKQTEIGYLPQQTIVQRDFPASVFEVVLSGCLNSRGMNPFYSKKEKTRVSESLRRLNIEEIKKKSYRDLSGGQQQRVLLARALCATDKILVLDEPVTGLDPIITAEFYTLVKKLNRENDITILMVSHDVSSAVQNSDKILHMGTKALFFGNTSDYLSSNISKGFLGGSQND
ncbi:MAG: ABC transporter [Clostridia bacterium BRH_c25]|nr:MAG: ABC transporter [Clostridia bacterium BRH_c25]